MDITAQNHLKSQCVDNTNSVCGSQIFSTQHSNPHHQKDVGLRTRTTCELHICRINTELAERSNIHSYECHHLQSLAYHPPAERDIPLLRASFTDHGLMITGNSFGKPEVWRRTASHNISPLIWKVLKKRKESSIHLRNEIPSDLVNTCNFPLSFTPSEAFCTEYSEVIPLSDPLIITAKARILTMTNVIERISMYSKECYRCGMIYRYQEWSDGIHNFDDHILLSIHLCHFLRFLSLFHAYSMSSLVSSIEEPPEDFDGHVNAENFWEQVPLEIISCGY
ncbi:Calmodulin-regulated spectrin-associated protein 1-B [Labeo rohita]|uniref:Calmodulin-regulated spectrin-associated protein 1-B n=1 Tax=Labeo rohita TaxID=84645 RepID=A0ABQ8L0G3_LABRO|nr:Calmodulin-regulated spectrin-associated protein 1-B [Labeo rohita]